MTVIKKGFTLVELTVTISLLAIVGMACYSVLTYYTRLSSSLESKNLVQESLDNFRKSIYAEIRNASSTIDPQNVGGVYQFPGTDMAYNNDYCKINLYRPLIYSMGINGSKVYYVYDKINKEIRKVEVPVDSSVTSGIKYFPVNIQLDSTNKGTNWDVINEVDIPSYESRSYNINEQVILKGLDINCDTTEDGITNPMHFTNFTLVGAYKATAYENIAIIKSNVMDKAGKLNWFKIFISPQNIKYYTNTKDVLISRNITAPSSDDAVTVTPNTSDAGNSHKYYEIGVSASYKGETRTMNFRVATVDFGGDIK